MVETKELLETLKHLQKVDQRLAHCGRMKEFEPARLAEAEGKAARAERLYDQLDADHKELQVKISSLELDIKSRDEKINRHKSQMLTVSNNREYQSLMKELSLEQVEKQRVEEELLELMIKLDGFSDREGEVQKEIDAAKADADRVRGEVAEALGELEVEEKAALQEREAAIVGIDAEDLRNYERLFISRNGVAIVRINYAAGPPTSEGRYVCGGCNMPLTHQMVNLLLIGRKMVTCQSCGRILYKDDESGGEY